MWLELNPGGSLIFMSWAKAIGFKATRYSVHGTWRGTRQKRSGSVLGTRHDVMGATPVQSRSARSFGTRVETISKDDGPLAGSNHERSSRSGAGGGKGI